MKFLDNGREERVGHVPPQIVLLWHLTRANEICHGGTLLDSESAAALLTPVLYLTMES